MNLTERIRQGRMSRRDFLELAGLGIGALTLGQCKGGSPTTPEPPPPPPPPPPPEKVTLQFNIYNHTKGLIKNYALEKNPDEVVPIRINELGVGGVDLQRIALREASAGGIIGNYVNFSRTGEITLTTPKQNMSYDIFLFNTSKGTNYDLLNHPKPGYIVPARYAHWMRQDDDGKTGPADAIQDVVSQFNNALNPSFMSYGSLTKVSSGGDVKIGYGLCLWYGVPQGGLHGTGDNSCQIWVNKEVCDQIGRNIRGVFIEELFEGLGGISDIDGTGSSSVRSQDRIFNIHGQELLTYIYAKDEWK